MTKGKAFLLALSASVAAAGGFASSGSISDRLSDAFIDRLSVAFNANDACGGPVWAGVGDACFASANRLDRVVIRVAAIPQSADAAGETR